MLKFRVLPGALSVQGYMEDWKVTPLTLGTTWLSHTPISVGEQGMGRSKNLIFCPSIPLFFFSISPRELVSHFHKQIPGTQRRTMLSKSLQSGSNTATCRHCQKSCGKAWYSPSQLRSPCRHPEQSQVLCFQRVYLSAVSAQLSSLKTSSPTSLYSGSSCSC